MMIAPVASTTACNGPPIIFLKSILFNSEVRLVEGASVPGANASRKDLTVLESVLITSSFVIDARSLGNELSVVLTFPGIDLKDALEEDNCLIVFIASSFESVSGSTGIDFRVA